MVKKKYLILGAGGFIGSNLIRAIKEKDPHCFITGVDIVQKPHDIKTDHYLQCDLRILSEVRHILNSINYDEIYQLAADVGGATYIFTGENDANVMTNSVMINLNILKAISEMYEPRPKIFFSSSACVYGETNDLIKESNAYPANPDSEYGWEKLFSERLYLSYSQNYNIPIRIGRLFNVYGPGEVWDGPKSKSAAAVCRKISETQSQNGEIDIIGDGNQKRSYLYIDDCTNAILTLMDSSINTPINIGSTTQKTINELVKTSADAAKKTIKTNHILSGPISVMNRTADNKEFISKTGWKEKTPFTIGIKRTYDYINKMVKIKNA